MALSEMFLWPIELCVFVSCDALPASLAVLGDLADCAVLDLSLCLLRLWGANLFV